MQIQQADIAPAEYAAAAVLANAVGEGLLARLSWMTLQPQRIVDVGCGIGHCVQLLKTKYPSAEVIGIDRDYHRLHYARQPFPSYYACAEAGSLPLRDHSVDLIFANLVLPWGSDHEKWLQEWQRVLRPQGLLIFSSLGPETLQAWQTLLAERFIPQCMDMHHVGDLLTRTRFADPVLDVESITVQYRQVDKWLQELHASDMIVAAPDLLQLPANADDRWTSQYEIIYGHAWAPTQFVSSANEIKIPLSALRRVSF